MPPNTSNGSLEYFLDNLPKCTNCGIVHDPYGPDLEATMEVELGGCRVCKRDPLC